jgi:ribosomal protein S18 acetylase RimI-like enzyme
MLFAALGIFHANVRRAAQAVVIWTYILAEEKFLIRFIRGIDHVQIAIPKNEEDAARKFYIEQLGFHEIEKPENQKKNGGFWLQAGVHQLHIGITENFHPAKKAHPAFKLRELEKYKKKIESNGIVTNPGDMLPGAKRFYVSDPFQNRIEFLEWEPENFIGDQLKKGNIRKPSVLDVSRLAEIHIYGWRHAYKGILSEDLLYNQRQVLRAISMHENIIQNDIDSIDLYDDGIIRGFIIHNDARDSELDGDYEVSAIYVEPEFLRKGYGSQLLNHAENIAQAKQKNGVSLWVLEGNQIGRRFYEKMGYLNTTKEKVDGDLKELLYRKAI